MKAFFEYMVLGCFATASVLWVVWVTAYIFHMVSNV